MRTPLLLVTSILFTLLPACRTASGPEVAARNQLIAQEPRGDHWIGRRVAEEETRFWGYIRRPGQTWDKAQLVVFNERVKLSPDRLPEMSSGDQRGFQFDNNYEYKLRGQLTGRQVYDPNSDRILPEFVLHDYELLNASPGFLFHPRERRNQLGIPVPPT